MAVKGNNVLINGGSFFQNNRIEGPEEAGMQKLYKHAAKDAFHDSRQRLKEVNHRMVTDILNDYRDEVPLEHSSSTSLPYASLSDRLVAKNVLDDVLAWLSDQSPLCKIMWVNGPSRTQTSLIAQTIAAILQKSDRLSAAFFFTMATTDATAVIPTISFQLASNIPQVGPLIASAIRNDLAVFDRTVETQMTKLVVEPLSRGDEQCSTDMVRVPDLILIHAIEDYSDDQDSLWSLLDTFAHALKSLEGTRLCQRLLVIGKYHSHVNECFSRSTWSEMVQKLSISQHGLNREQDAIHRKKEELRKREGEIVEHSRRIQKREEDMGAQEEEFRRRILRKEEEFRLREDAIHRHKEELRKRKGEIAEHSRRIQTREEDIGAQEEEFRERILKKEVELRLREEDLKRKEAQLGQRQEEQGRVMPRGAGRVFDVNLVYTLKFGHEVQCLRFSPYGHFLATGCGDGATQIYDVKTGQMICVLKEWTVEGVHVRCLRFSPDGHCLATGANDDRIRIWDLSSRRIRNSIKVQKGVVNAIDFSLDGRFLVAGTLRNIVAIYHVRDGTLLRGFKSDFIISSVRFSPDGQYIAAANITKILIWDVRTGESKVKHGLHRHSELINSVAFMSDGVSGSEDDLWDRAWMEMDPNTKPERDGAGNNMEISTFVGHRGAVDSVAMSQDGQWIIYGSTDHTARIWDAHSAAACQGKLQGHVAVDFSPSGDYLATGSKDGQVRLWKTGS